MNRQIYEEAAEWLTELRSEQADYDTRKRFERWLSTSPEHIRAYLELSATWESVAAQQRAEPEEVEALIDRARGSGAENVARLAPWRRLRPTPPTFPRHFAAAAAAAVLALLIIGVTELYPRGSIFTTAIGEQRSLLLSDGSTIDLNARSRVRVSFDAHSRRVELLEGQALFHVAKDKTRPFVVAASGTRVRAVGTEFDINERKRETIVTVVEGTVAVSGPARTAPTSTPTEEWTAGTTEPHALGSARAPPASAKSSSDSIVPLQRAPAMSPEPGEILLDAGEALALPPVVLAPRSAQLTEAPRRVDAGAATAWTHRRLIFDSTPLEDVVAEFNRNSDRVLVLRDHNLDNFHVSGAFSSTDVKPFLRFLRSQEGVEVIEESDRIIIAGR